MALNLVARLSLDDQLSNRLGRINNNMNKTQNSANRLSDSVKGIGSSIATIGGAIGLTAAVAGGFNMVRNSIGGAMDRIDTMESFERVMTVLTGSSERTAAALEATREAVTGTAYGLDIAAKGVQDFVTRGMDIEKATGTMSAWADAVAFYGDGSNEQLASVSDALAKMYSSGKVQMDQMNRLYDAGIDGVGMYATAVGRDVETVQKDLSSGRISADEFISVVSTAMMEGTNGVVKIAGAAKEAGESWGAAFANMRAAVTRGVQNIILKIDEMLAQNGLPEMRAMVSEFGRRFEDALNKVVEYIPTLIDYLQRLLAYWPLIKNGVIGLVTALISFRGIMIGLSIIGTVTTLLKAFRAGTLAATLAQYGLNTAMLMNPMTWVVAGIAALIAAGVLLWRNWDTVKEKAGEMWAKIKERWDLTKSATADAWESVKASIGNAMDNARQKVSDFFSPLFDFIDRAKKGWEDFKSSITGGFKLPKIGIPKVFGGGGLIQSHFHGIDRVHRDRTPALLHRGERVLTRQEADALDRFSYGGLMGGGNRGGKQTYNNVSNTQAGGGSSQAGGINIAKLADEIIVREEADIDKITFRLAQKLKAAMEAGA